MAKAAWLRARPKTLVTLRLGDDGSADFQVGPTALRPAGLETRDTADLEVCATMQDGRWMNRVMVEKFIIVSISE